MALPNKYIPAKKSKRRFIIPLATAIAGFTVGVPTGIWLDTKPSLNKLWKDTIQEAVDKRQWLHIGGCEGVVDKQKVTVRVYKFALGVSRFRSMIIDEFVDGSISPTRTSYPSHIGESTAKYEKRIMEIALQKCGRSVQKLQR